MWKFLTRFLQLTLSLFRLLASAKAERQQTQIEQGKKASRELAYLRRAIKARNKMREENLARNLRAQNHEKPSEQNNNAHPVDGIDTDGVRQDRYRRD